VNQQRLINREEQEAPDDWIDEYDAGLRPPVSTRYSSRSAVCAELEPYQGKALEWFGWIDLFRALVHDTPKSPGEKLALLKRYLRDECLDVVYGLGGGEAAYIQALVRLKETYGRRDVMKAAHLTALGQLEPNGEGASFKRFAEKVRSHLFDLSRIGETSAADVIEKICLKLNLQDRLAWNENRRGRLEERSLNEFGSWLCSRAAVYQNAYGIAASQINVSSNPVKEGFAPRRSRSHYTAGKTYEEDAGTRSSKPYCFNCEESHWLVDCEEFKILPVSERVHFCVRRRLCFSCFCCKHSFRECPSSRPCKFSDCRYTHHPLLHDEEKLPVKSSRPSTARAKRDQGVALGMLRLQIQGRYGGWTWANVLADEGSDTTLVRNEFATSLKIRGSPQILKVDGTGGVLTSHASELIHFQLCTEFGEVVTLEGSTMKEVASPAPFTDWSKEKSRWSHLRDLPVGEVGGRVDILIGTDHFHLLSSRESREGEDYEPIASRTRLGWIIRGVTNREARVSAVRNFTISEQTHLEPLNGQMRHSCDVEQTHAAKKTLADADLNPPGWEPNSTELLRPIVDSVDPELENIQQLNSNLGKEVVGVSLDTHLDNLGIKMAETPHNTHFTKLELASRAAGAFHLPDTTSPINVEENGRLRELGQDGLQWTDDVKAAARYTLDGDIWRSGPDILLCPEEDWPAASPWVQINDIARDVSWPCGLKDKLSSLIHPCQEELLTEEIHRLQKKKALHFVVFLFSALLIFLGFLGNRLSRFSCCREEAGDPSAGYRDLRFVRWKLARPFRSRGRMFPRKRIKVHHLRSGNKASYFSFCSLPLIVIASSFIILPSAT
jgi:hypothetical protein